MSTATYSETMDVSEVRRTIGKLKKTQDKGSTMTVAEGFLALAIGIFSLGGGLTGVIFGATSIRMGVHALTYSSLLGKLDKTIHRFEDLEDMIQDLGFDKVQVKGKFYVDKDSDSYVVTDIYVTKGRIENTNQWITISY